MSKKALIIVHQRRSSTGDVGIKLKQRGYKLDVRRPSLGESLPDNIHLFELMSCTANQLVSLFYPTVKNANILT